MIMYNSKLYNTRYHSYELSQYSYLITGGAGFIGSNIVEYLLRNNAKKVRVLDNLSNGYWENIRDFENLDNFEFIKGDIRDLETCQSALQGIDFVSHQAALGSVPRSIADPITSNEVNVGGFLNIMVAAKDNGNIRKFVYAASSSTYGDSKELPKVEGQEGKALSPYAVTKAVNEMYAHVFGKVYDFNAVGLRYFNVFGPKQNPNNPYAAVIPIFCKHFLNNSQPIINGNGETSRDFTFVENAVQANIKAFELQNGEPEIFNVACGERTSLNEIITLLNELTGQALTPIYKPERLGDVKHSLASIEKSKGMLGYNPLFSFAEGLAIVFEWYATHLSKLA